VEFISLAVGKILSAQFKTTDKLAPHQDGREVNKSTQTS